MPNWPRIRCTLFGHGRIGKYGDLGLTVYLCERCGQILAVRTDSIGFIDKAHFARSYESWQPTPELSGVWQEWGRG